MTKLQQSAAYISDT